MEGPGPFLEAGTARQSDGSIRGCSIVGAWRATGRESRIVLLRLRLGCQRLRHLPLLYGNGEPSKVIERRWASSYGRFRKTVP